MPSGGPGSPDFRPNVLTHPFHGRAETLRAVCLHAALRFSMRHQAQETGKTHARQRLAKCPDLSFGHGWKSYHIGFGRENADHFLRFLQHADLLRFGRAKVLHQGKHFLMAQGLHDATLPLVKFGCSMRVGKVAVRAGIAIGTMSLQEVDALPTADLWMPQATGTYGLFGLPSHGRDGYRRLQGATVGWRAITAADIRW